MNRALSTFALAAVACALHACGKTVDVGPDEFLVVIAHDGDELAPGQMLAREGQKGVREHVLGPGRHVVDRFGVTIERHPMLEILPGSPSVKNGDTVVPAQLPQVGVVTALVGAPLPPGSFLADEGQRGVRRRVLTPGRYALNPYAYTVEVHDAVVVPTGSVGVVTHLDGVLSSDELAGPDQRGVQRDVLHAGVHFLNPLEYSVNHIRIGWRELSFTGKHAIQFPSSDSNTITAEMSLIWGLLPEDAPYLVKRYGSEKDVIERVIKPQVESIVRLKGSNLSSRQFMEGDARVVFQDEVTVELKAALEKKKLRVLLALVRGLEVPEAVRKPFQLARLAEEEVLTNVELEATARVNARFNTLKGEVAIAIAETKAEIQRQVAEEEQRGAAAVETLEARTKLEAKRREAASREQRMLAATTVSEAEIDAQAVLGDADAEGERRLVEALGGAGAYRVWKLAKLIPSGLAIELRAKELRYGSESSGQSSTATAAAAKS